MSETTVKFGLASIGDQLKGVIGGINPVDSGTIARVTFVLYDDSDLDRFNAYGGWKGLGTIECVPYMYGASTTSVLVAKPDSAHHSKWPVINELVHVKQSVGSKSQGGITNYSPEWYYTNVINTWNAVEHNATPDSNLLAGNKQNISTYADTTGGNTHKNIASDTSITGIFKDTGNVTNLRKGPGDISQEGRSGHALKFGSTIDGFNQNIKGPDRSPFTILSNGRTGDSKIPSFEDINKDGSSIYFLNGHDANFKASSLNFESFGMKPSDIIRSNYIDNVQTPNVPLSASAAVTDKAVVAVDTPPVVLPLATSPTPANATIAADEDLQELPDSEGPIVYVQETQDFTEDLKKSYNVLIKNDNAVLVSVPTRIKFENQGANTTYCFIASTSMILRSLGVPTSQNELSRFIGAGDLFNSQKALASYGKTIERISILGGAEGYQQIIDKFNSFKKPFILERIPMPRKNGPPKDPVAHSHFVVVVGISSNGKIITYNPGTVYGAGLELKESELKPKKGTLRIIK
jgi:hypothetical protein